MTKCNAILATTIRLVVIAFVVYAVSYLAVRASHVMTRTGWYHNAYFNDVHASDAGWNNLRVSVANGSALRRPTTPPGALELFFKPLIYLECQHFYMFGYEPGRSSLPPCCVRNRNLGYAAMFVYGLVAIGAARFLWRAARRLNSHGPNSCSKCGYDLQGLPETTCCPECGQSIDAAFTQESPSINQNRLCRRLV